MMSYRSSCLWLAQGVYPTPSGAATEKSLGNHTMPVFFFSASGTQVGAYGDLAPKEQQACGVEGGLPGKILEWAKT